MYEVGHNILICNNTLININIRQLNKVTHKCRTWPSIAGRMTASAATTFDMSLESRSADFSRYNLEEFDFGVGAEYFPDSKLTDGH